MLQHRAQDPSINDKNINSVAAAARQAATENEGLKKQVADLAKQLKESKDEVASRLKKYLSLGQRCSRTR